MATNEEYPELDPESPTPRTSWFDPEPEPKRETFYEKQFGGGRQGMIADYASSMGDVMVRNAEADFKEALTRHKWSEFHRFRKELGWRRQKGLKT